MCDKIVQQCLITLGPFIREKIRPDLPKTCLI